MAWRMTAFFGMNPCDTWLDSTQRDDMWSWCVANISTNGSCAYTYISRVTISKSKWCLSCSSDQPQIKQEIGNTAKKDKGLCPTMDWAYTNYLENTSENYSFREYFVLLHFLYCNWPLNVELFNMEFGIFYRHTISPYDNQQKILLCCTGAGFHSAKP